MTREALPSMETKLVQVGNYKFTGKVLGKGSFAVVREATHTKMRVNVSVKTIDLKKCNNYTLKNYLREATMLQYLDHPFIMRLFETIKHNDMYFMVTEKIQGGDLCVYVQQKRGKIEQNITRRFSRQIASALRYLHRRKIIHRDLKLENVMLDSAKKNIKLIDFGLTNQWSHDSPLKTLCGSPEYSAPELFIPGTVYGPEVDMWALGVIMFALAAGRLPFPCLSSIMKVPEKKSQFLKKINNGLSEDQTRLIKDYSLEFIRLVQGLMNPIWEERLTIHDVFNDTWITNRDHWIDVPYESLDAYDLEKIMRQVSHMMNISPEKLKSELKTKPCGEAGGVFNIMVYKEILERHHEILDIKSTTPQNVNSSCLFHEDTSSKKKSAKQISQGPIKISLLGNAMKLNEVTFTSTPVPDRVTTPSDSSTMTSEQSECGIKRITNENRQPKLLLPRMVSRKSNCSTPQSDTPKKTPPRAENKSVQVNTTSRRKMTPVRIILPSKPKGSTKSLWERESNWLRKLV